jgi:hypothetical protein
LVLPSLSLIFYYKNHPAVKPGDILILFDATIIGFAKPVLTESDQKAGVNKQPIDTWWTL